MKDSTRSNVIAALKKAAADPRLTPELRAEAARHLRNQERMQSRSPAD